MEVMEHISESEYNKLFVTSDTHFNHNKEFIYKHRNYNSPSEMNKDMINIINSTVGEEGILLHLGDFCLNATSEEYYNILKRLKIKEIWMVWGNHNNPIRKKHGKDYHQVCAFHGNIMIRYLDYYFTFRRGKKVFVCFHFPIHVWDGMGRGSMHLCGHSHGGLNVSRPENTTHKILDCGWDIHKKPLSMKEIEKIMMKKGTNNLHHSSSID